MFNVMNNLDEQWLNKKDAGSSKVTFTALTDGARRIWAKTIEPITGIAVVLGSEA